MPVSIGGMGGWDIKKVGLWMIGPLWVGQDWIYKRVQCQFVPDRSVPERKFLGRCAPWTMQSCRAPEKLTKADTLLYVFVSLVWAWLLSHLTNLDYHVFPPGHRSSWRAGSLFYVFFSLVWAWLLIIWQTYCSLADEPAHSSMSSSLWFERGFWSSDKLRLPCFPPGAPEQLTSRYTPLYLLLFGLSPASDHLTNLDYHVSPPGHSSWRESTRVANSHYFHKYF